MTKKKKCIMIETSDHRQFFTHKKNYPQLIEFANAFGAEISTVQTEEAEILDLSPLAKAFSNPDYKSKGTFTKIKVDLKPDSAKVATCPILPIKINEISTPKRNSNSAEIKQYIKNCFMSNETVSLKKIRSHFKEMNIASSSICNYIAKVKLDLKNEGFEIKKVNGSEYVIS